MYLRDGKCKKAMIIFTGSCDTWNLTTDGLSRGNDHRQLGRACGKSGKKQFILRPHQNAAVIT